jgi:hypothetical protein
MTTLQDKKTALHIASVKGYLILVKALLSLGANIEAIDGVMILLAFFQDS